LIFKVLNDGLTTRSAKKIKGRKRHVITDTTGLLVGAEVHPADMQDRDGAPLVIAAIHDLFPWLRHLFADMVDALLKIKPPGSPFEDAYPALLSEKELEGQSISPILVAVEELRTALEPFLLPSDHGCFGFLIHVIETDEFFVTKKVFFQTLRGGIDLVAVASFLLDKRPASTRDEPCPADRPGKQGVLPRKSCGPRMGDSWLIYQQLVKDCGN
jgi:hypothetical protein